MTTRSRRFVVRAHYRHRYPTALRPETLPQLADVWIDKLQLEFRGTCRLLSGSGQDQLSDYFDSFPYLVATPLGAWFTDPQFRPGSPYRNIKTVQAPIQTLGALMARLGPRHGGQAGWDFNVELQVNPTRTLASLLSIYAQVEPEDFIGAISGLALDEFFAVADDMPRSLDGGTNWVANWERMETCLGADPFGTFLPIYLAKLQSLVEHIVNPSASEPRFSNQGELRICEDAGMRVEIDTANVKVPQSEVYFERYHGQALAGMREAALSAIDKLREVESTFFIAGTESGQRTDRSTVARQASGLQVSTQLPNNSRLAIYSKSERRIRFEIRRHGTIRWPDVAEPSFSPMQRLQQRLDYERGRWVADGRNALRWPNIFSLFEEPRRPHIGDMAELLEKVCEVATRHGASVGMLVRKLVGDGGVIPEDQDDISSNVLDALVRVGVMQRVRVAQRREGKAASRYALSNHYLTVVQEMALLPSIRDEMDR